MAENDIRKAREQQPSVLIPLDAEEAMLALQRFRRTGAGEAPFGQDEGGWGMAAASST
jgi:hypothetical protein